MNLQDEIDSITYPPTHTYKLKGLTPTGSLATRMQVIQDEFPEFFQDGILLDVGCNKGFFSLYHRGKVIGIDPDEKCIELCRKLKHDGEFYISSFGEFTSKIQFNRIFIGNGHHYPFIESEGWYFLEKLGNLTAQGGLVLLEGPVDLSGADAKKCIPEHLAEEFTLKKLLGAFSSLFHFRKIVASPLSDRYFLLFEKRDDRDIYQRYLRSLYHLMAKYTNHTDTVMEICTRHDRGMMSQDIIPHDKYILVDRDPRRLGASLDAVRDVLPKCHVAISTAVFHHTAPEDVEKLFKNIARNTKHTIIISGPSDDMGVGLYGDHLYHLNLNELSLIALRAGWNLSITQRTGIKHCTPYEWLLVFNRRVM